VDFDGDADIAGPLTLIAAWGACARDRFGLSGNCGNAVDEHEIRVFGQCLPLVLSGDGRSRPYNPAGESAMLPTIALADTLYWNFMEYVVRFLICIAIGAMLYYFSRDRAKD
jgi:hypothetical protein